MLNSQTWKELLVFLYTNEHSSFYKNLYDKAGFNPVTDFHSLQDISKIPILKKSDLLSVPSDMLRFVPPSEVRSMSATSGTTSAGSLLTFHSPSVLTSQSTASEHSDYGVDMLLFNPIRAGALLYYYNQRKQTVILGDVHNIPLSCALAGQAQVRTITTTPTFAIILKKHIDRQPNLLKSLKYLRLGGEVLSSSKKEYLRSLYSQLEIFTIYASSELGRPASQCIHLSKNDTETLYHPNYESYYLEILDNELVVTDFSNKATPLIRYRTGDLAQLIDTPCPCGATGPLLAIHGRVHRDSVRAGGFEIRRDMIEKPILKLQNLIQTNYEVHVYERYISEKPFLRIILNLALKEGVNNTQQVYKEIIQTFTDTLRFSPTFSFKEAMAFGFFAPLELEFVTFPNQIKTTENIILHI